MKLIELAKMTKLADWYVYDTNGFDCIHISWSKDTHYNNAAYDRFISSLLESVDIAEVGTFVTSPCKCDWSGMISNNYEKWVDFIDNNKDWFEVNVSDNVNDTASRIISAINCEIKLNQLSDNEYDKLSDVIKKCA